ncbi:MFS transporter [Demequina gelatinilytica]|uniref:MFS transporter n=1 Tax=Demequina gelatinilytica TaxID=1638980 RepID=UPI000783984A|nr:MFS transporter [Demequina gelatinilytica]
MADLTSVPETTEPDPTRWRMLAVIAVAQLMIILDGSIVNVALPHIQEALAISDANRQWVVTAYTLAFGGLLLLGGRVADYWGRKRTFIVGLLGFAAASALGGLAPAEGFMFAARGLQGMFAALLAPAALSLVTVAFTEPHERAKAFGVFGALSGGGAAIGLILGGLLTDGPGWRWVMWVNVPIALVTAALAVGMVRESRSDGHASYDIPGALLATSGLLALVYGFTRVSEADAGWADPLAIACLAAAAVLLVTFVLVERRVAHPLLPLRIPAHPIRGGSYLTFLLVGAGLFAMFLFLSYYMQGVLGYSALRTGLHFLPFSLGIILAAGLVARVLPVTGPRPLMVGGLAVAGTGMLMLLRITPQDQYWTHVLPSLVMISVGMAFVFIPTSSTALIGVQPRDAGVASALLNTTQQVGGSVGLALLSTLALASTTRSVEQIGTVERAMPDGSVAQVPGPESLVAGFHTGFLWGAVLLYLGMLSALLLVRIRKADYHANVQDAESAPAV